MIKIIYLFPIIPFISLLVSVQDPTSIWSVLPEGASVTAVIIVVWLLLRHVKELEEAHIKQELIFAEKMKEVVIENHLCYKNIEENFRKMLDKIISSNTVNITLIAEKINRTIVEKID